MSELKKYGYCYSCNKLYPIDSLIRVIIVKNKHVGTYIGNASNYINETEEFLCKKCERISNE